MRLLNKVALVTGGNRGIGEAVVLAFAREGARIAILGGRDRPSLDRVAQAVASLGREALAYAEDVSNRAAVDDAVAQVIERWGKIDILVNNAGICNPHRFEKISESDWQSTLSVHLNGAFHCTQAVLPGMKAKGGGKIVNVSAPSALRASFGVADYAVAKGGIIALTRNLANELKSYNIQVNCISPVAETRITESLDAFRRQQDSEPPRGTGRTVRAKPEAITPAFVFFASPDSDYITGQVLAVDGGRTV